MTLGITHENEICIVMIPQRFDAATAPGTEADLKAFLGGSSVKKLILDFSRTEYVASAGLKVILLITRDLMKSGGRVVLAGLTPAVLRVFEMAGFTSIFSLSPSREEAIRQLS